MIRRSWAVFGAGVLCLASTVGVANGQEKGDAAKGKDVFDGQCGMCHSADTAEKKMGPSLQHLFQHKTLMNGKPVNDGTVMDQINNGGNGMPPFGDQLTADDKANLLAYLHKL